MLNRIKQIYDLIPIPISDFLIKFFNLNPYYSLENWKIVNEIEEKHHDLILLNDNLINKLNTISGQGYFKNKSLTKNFFFEENFMDSEILRESFKEIINENIRGYFTSTGGSGRNPSKLYLSNESYRKDVCHVLWSWKNLGYAVGDRKLTLRGMNLGKKLWKYNPIYNELQINIFLLNEENVDILLFEIEKFNPNFGHGYPSAFYKLAKLLENKKQTFKLKGISLASEGFNEVQRNFIEKIFKCDTRGFYGHSEREGFASEKIDEKGVYEILLTYGLIEIIKEKRENCNIGEEGEIVCTGFINKGMNLIRYKTGDYATVHKIKDNIIVEIKNIKGRWGKDFVYDKNRNSIPTTAINIHSEEQYEFKYIQLYQKNYGELEIRLVSWNSDKSNKFFLEKIKEDFFRKLQNINIEVKLVEEDKIYKTHRGKVPYLISELKS